ncbi:MAG TPA: response regulator, partial [Candidatus Xenobia bacterium]
MARILIVDDSPTQAQSLAMLLDGHDVGMASGGEEARARLREGHWDLVVSDVVMPGESGYDLCRAIKREWHVPVLVLTSLSNPGEILRALEAGADSFATKNGAPEILLQRIDALLSGRTEADPVQFMGQTYRITAGRAQILSLLLATFEDMVRKNELLVEGERQLEEK